MKCAVAIFAKTIGMSPVKTRLAASIGQENAEAFYRLSVACIEAVMQNCINQNSYVYPHWVLGEEHSPKLEVWKSFPAFWTGEGGLGDRLANVSHQLLHSHDCVLMIGTDSPQMSAKRILQIYEAFAANPELDHVACPATDGGFWLWGSRKTLPLKVWNSVTYSADTTLEELVAATNKHGHNVYPCYPMQDVDELKDLATLQVTLEQKGKTLLPAQELLLKWLQEHNPTFQG